MQPYYDHGGVTIYHARWEEVLPALLADGVRVNCVLADPNYGTTQLDWDTPWDWPRFWAALKAITPPAAVQAFFSMQPFTTDLITSNRQAYRYEVIWHKTTATGFLDAKRRPLRAHEAIQVFCRTPGKSTYNPQKQAGTAYYKAGSANRLRHSGSHHGAVSAYTDRFPTDVWSFSNGHGGKSDHPTAKPLALLERMVATWSNPGDLLLDPGIGRGTACRAAKNLGRRIIGCDYREACCERAARWCEQEVLELTTDVA